MLALIYFDQVCKQNYRLIYILDCKIVKDGEVSGRNSKNGNTSGFLKRKLFQYLAYYTNGLPVTTSILYKN